MHRRAIAFAVLALALGAACGGGDDPAPSGVSTALPTGTSEATATTEGSATGTSTPVATSTATATPATGTVVTSTATPTELSDRLAALGGEDSGTIAELLADVSPRCQQTPEEFVALIERGWIVLRDSFDIALPVSSMIARIRTELPPGTSRENCETLITAVITEIANR